MRATTLGSLTATAVLAVLAPLVPSVAGAAAPTDVVAEACRGADGGSLVSGTPTRSTLVRERLRGLGSVEVTGVRLTYPNGVRCDVVSVDGRLPFGRDVKGYGSDLSDWGMLVVAGAAQPETERNRVSIATRSSRAFREFDHQILGALVYAPTESGTLPAYPDVPTEWQGQPYTFTHTRTEASIQVQARRGVEKHFTVTPATRAAAARRLEQDLALATSAADRRDARRVHRLALRGIRLEMRPFRARWSGELPG